MFLKIVQCIYSSKVKRCWIKKYADKYKYFLCGGFRLHKADYYPSHASIDFDPTPIWKIGWVLSQFQILIYNRNFFILLPKILSS